MKSKMIEEIKSYFHSKKNTDKNRLQFIGATYYEQLLIFKDLTPKVLSILGFPIKRLELAYNIDKLTSVWFYLDEKKFDDLLDVFESYLKKKASINNDYEFRPPKSNSIEYYWRDKDYILCLGNNQFTDEYYIYFTQVPYCLHHLE